MLEVEDLHVSYGSARRHGAGRRPAVDGVTFSVAPGEIVGLVGESGCGKTSVARAVVGSVAPQHGQLRLNGVRLGKKRPAAVRRRIQMVFQDPGTSLDPRMTVRRTLGYATRGRGHAIAPEELSALLERVGLPLQVADEKPEQLSGGQRQRVAIARGLATQPDLVVADEVVASLDVSAAGAVLNLLREVATTLDVGILFISHDLSVVRRLCDRTLVMYLGQIVESGATDSLFDRPGHPYTRALIDSTPSVHERQNRPALRGDEALADTDDGCSFRMRCPLATDRCVTEDPELTGVDHEVRCHFAFADR